MNQFLKGWFPRRYGTPEVPFRQFLTLYQAALYLNKSKDDVFEELTHSTLLHGVILNGKVFVHPSEVTNRMIRETKKLVRKEIKTTSLLLKT